VAAVRSTLQCGAGWGLLYLAKTSIGCYCWFCLIHSSDYVSAVKNFVWKLQTTVTWAWRLMKPASRRRQWLLLALHSCGLEPGVHMEWRTEKFAFKLRLACSDELSKRACFWYSLLPRLCRSDSAMINVHLPCQTGRHYVFDLAVCLDRVITTLENMEISGNLLILENSGNLKFTQGIYQMLLIVIW